MNANKIHGCVCRNCGIEFITQNKSSDTYCRFCGAPALMAQDYEKINLPEFVLPFEVSKLQALQIVSKHLSQRPLSSSALFQKVKSGFIREVYIPVNVADIQVTTEVTVLDASGNERTKQVISRASDTAVCQSSMFDEYLFRLLGKYDFSRAVTYDSAHASIPFEKPAQFSSDRSFDELESVSFKAVIDSFGDRREIRKTLSSRQFDKNYDGKTVLVPVWILSNISKGYTDQIFINGQSGRIIGEPPASFRKGLAIFGGIVAGCTIIGELICTAVNIL